MLFRQLFNVYGVSFAVSWAPLVAVDDILEHVSRFHDVPVDAILSRSTKREHTLSRHEAMWLSRKLVACSLAKLGFEFNRDRSAVLQGIRNIDRHLVRQGAEGGDIILLLQKFPNVTWH